MKRLTLAGVLALGLGAFVFSNVAAQPLVRWDTSALKFRRNGSGQLGVSGTVVDSAVFRQVGTPVNSAQPTDTTVGFPLTQCPILMSGSADYDTSDVCQLIVRRTRNSANFGWAEDTINVIAQVSHDNVGWVALTNTDTERILLEEGSSGSFQRFYKESLVTGAQLGRNASGTAPTDVQLLGWQFIRFLIRSDAQGEYEAYLGHWVNANAGAPAQSE